MEDNINIEISNEDTLKGKYLTFYVDSQLFGIQIADVVQIVGIQEITPVPEFPIYAKGIINLRDIIIPIIDIRMRLNKEEKEYTEITCIIVTNINNSLIGFVVDSVNEVTEIKDENVSGTPNIGTDYTKVFANKVAKLSGKVVLLIDLKKILNEKEMSSITSLGETNNE